MGGGVVQCCKKATTQRFFSTGDFGCYLDLNEIWGESIHPLSPGTCHPSRTRLFRRYPHLPSERPKDGLRCNCAIEILGGSGSCKLRPRTVSIPGTIGDRKLLPKRRKCLSHLWTGICGLFVTGSGRMMLNSTTYWYHCAGAHKPIYEAQKDDQQQSAPDGKLHQLFRGKVVIAFIACHRFLHSALGEVDPESEPVKGSIARHRSQVKPRQSSATTFTKQWRRLRRNLES